MHFPMKMSSMISFEWKSFNYLLKDLRKEAFFDFVAIYIFFSGIQFMIILLILQIETIFMELLLYVTFKIFFLLFNLARFNPGDIVRLPVYCDWRKMLSYCSLPGSISLYYVCFCFTSNNLVIVPLNSIRYSVYVSFFNDFFKHFIFAMLCVM